MNTITGLLQGEFFYFSLLVIYYISVVLKIMKFIILWSSSFVITHHNLRVILIKYPGLGIQMSPILTYNTLCIEISLLILQFHILFS
jgi:hypothetical protein